MKKFIITEEEKKNILSMYSILTEQVQGEQKLDVSKLVGKTYKLYLEPGGKSTKFDWDNPADTHPKPANFLPNGKDYFDVKIKAISYFSANTQYSFLCEGINNNGEKIPYEGLYEGTYNGNPVSLNMKGFVYYKNNKYEAKWKCENGNLVIYNVKSVPQMKVPF